jgi:hypothetical protein
VRLEQKKCKTNEAWRLEILEKRELSRPALDHGTKILVQHSSSSRDAGVSSFRTLSARCSALAVGVPTARLELW